MESLTRRLPNLFSQHPELTDDAEVWSWSYFGSMIDFGINWIATRSDPQSSKLQGGDISATSLSWVYAAMTHMLLRVLGRVTLQEANGHVPCLPEFSPKIRLELIKYWHLAFKGQNVVMND
jgi:RNA polymerase II-associated protein 1